MKNALSDLSSEQAALLKNLPHGGPLHELSMPDQKLISDGYIWLDPACEVYQLTPKGAAAVDIYDKLRKSK